MAEPSSKRSRVEAQGERSGSDASPSTSAQDAAPAKAEEGAVDANEALTFTYDSALGESFVFHPEMTHQCAWGRAGRGGAGSTMVAFGSGRFEDASALRGEEAPTPGTTGDRQCGMCRVHLECRNLAPTMFSACGSEACVPLISLRRLSPCRIYGDNETISGPPGLAISVRLSPALYAYGSASGGKAADHARALGPLREAFGGQLYQDETAWAVAARKRPSEEGARGGAGEGRWSVPTRAQLGLETILERGVWASVRQGKRSPAGGVQSKRSQAENGRAQFEPNGEATGKAASEPTGEATAEAIGEHKEEANGEAADEHKSMRKRAVEGGAGAPSDAAKESETPAPKAAVAAVDPAATDAPSEGEKSAKGAKVENKSRHSDVPSSGSPVDPSVPQLYSTVHPDAVASLRPHEPIPTSGPVPLTVPLNELPALDAQLLEPADASEEVASGLGWDALPAGATEGRLDASLLIVGGNLKSASPAARELHERFQKLLLFFVDAASLIDQEEPEWELLLAFDTQRKEGGKEEEQDVNPAAPAAPLCPVGMATLRVFPAFPDARRVRVSQVLVLPPFQGRGIGAALTRAAYVRAGQLSARDVTIEDPSEHMAFLDDRTCLRAAFAFRGASPAREVDGSEKDRQWPSNGEDGRKEPAEPAERAAQPSDSGKATLSKDAPHSVESPLSKDAAHSVESPLSKDASSPLAFVREAYAAAQTILASKGHASLRPIPAASPAALASLRDPLLIGFKHARQIWSAAVMAAAGRAAGERDFPEALAPAARAAALRELQALAEPGTEPALRGPRAKRLKDVEGGFVMCRRSDGEAPEVQTEGEAADGKGEDDEGETVTPEEAADARAQAAVTLATACV